jgi:hypothetical protein
MFNRVYVYVDAQLVERGPLLVDDNVESYRCERKSKRILLVQSEKKSICYRIISSVNL